METARNPNTFILVVLILMKTCTFPGCNAGRFYCQSTGSQTIRIGRQVWLEDTFVPEYDVGDNGWHSSQSGEQSKCDWTLQLVAREPRQIFLTTIPRHELTDERQKRAVPAVEDNSDQAVEFYLHDSRTDNRNCSQRPKNDRKLFDNSPAEILTLLSGQEITVSISQPRMAHKSLNALRVVSIDPGYCAKDMVSHRGSCYSIVQLNTRLNETFRAEQLAAHFNSFDDVLSFVRSNQAELEGVFPVKEPLNLTMPVHIGLFLTKDQRVKFVSISGGICAFKEVQNSSDFLSKSWVNGGPCGALRVNGSGSPVVEFVPCGLQLPTLISFPDAPRSACESCGREMAELVRSEISQPSARTEVRRNDALLMAQLIVLGSTAVLCALHITLAVTILLKRSRRTKNSAAKSRQQDIFYCCLWDSGVESPCTDMGKIQSGDSALTQLKLPEASETGHQEGRLWTKL